MSINKLMTTVLGTREDESSEGLDALAIIHRDHEEVSRLFEIALGKSSTSAQKSTATTKIVDALTMHAKMEEKIFYPALRRAGKAQEKDSVLEALEEHGVVKDLLAKIARVKGRDETLQAKLTVLKEMVQHHVQEEESTMFPEARRVLGPRLKSLGDEMQQFKEGGRARVSANGRAKKSSRTVTRKLKRG